MEKEWMIVDFIASKLNNGRLPWNKTPLPVSQSGWQNSDAANFLWRQWQVLAPILGPKKGLRAPHYEFPSSRPLPFTQSRKDTPKDGGYGTVNIVTIPRAHNKFASDSVSLSTP
jgi:hypothetical protein